MRRPGWVHFSFMTAPLPRDVARRLPHAMVRLRARLRTESAPRDTELTWTWPQMAVLSRLAQDGPATISELAVAEHVRPQSMAETVSALLAQGWVVRGSDPKDGRKTPISITEKGGKLISSIPVMRETWLEAAIEEHLSLADRRTLDQAAQIMERLADS